MKVHFVQGTKKEWSAPVPHSFIINNENMGDTHGLIMIRSKFR